MVTPYRTVQCVEDVQRTVGGAARTGPGANDAGLDPLPALEAWVKLGATRMARPPGVLPSVPIRRLLLAARINAYRLNACPRSLECPAVFA